MDFYKNTFEQLIKYVHQFEGAVLRYETAAAKESEKQQEQQNNIIHIDFKNWTKTVGGG